MLALAVFKASVHDACGHYLPDATAPDAEDRYEAELPIRCHACTARARAYKLAEDQGMQHPEAVLWPVKRRG